MWGGQRRVPVIPASCQIKWMSLAQDMQIQQTRITEYNLRAPVCSEWTLSVAIEFVFKGGTGLDLDF